MDGVRVFFRPMAVDIRSLEKDRLYPINCVILSDYRRIPLFVF